MPTKGFLKVVQSYPYFTRNQIQLIYAPPRDFALAEPKMHQKLCHFIHIKFEQFVGHLIIHQQSDHIRCLTY